MISLSVPNRAHNHRAQRFSRGYNAPDAVVSVGSGGIYAAPFVSGNNGVAFGTQTAPTHEISYSGMTPAA